MLHDENRWLCHEPDGTIRTSGPTSPLVFPGSFNPLHRAHLELAHLASQRLQLALAFELSIANVDKADLHPDDIHRRLEQFRGSHPLYVTRAATFLSKAQLFPGSTFVVGADTAARIVQPRYYGNESRMLMALDEIRAQGCRFFVGGRIDGDGRFVDLEGIALPEAHRDLFVGLGESEFRVDVSSTSLREESKR